jgi:hypothetical protein
MATLSTINNREELIAYQLLDDLALAFADDHTVLLFDATDEGETKTYAALFAGDKWWVTGRTSPNGADLKTCWRG